MIECSTVEVFIPIWWFWATKNPRLRWVLRMVFVLSFEIQVNFRHIKLRHVEKSVIIHD